MGRRHFAAVAAVVVRRPCVQAAQKLGPARLFLSCVFRAPHKCSLPDKDAKAQWIDITYLFNKSPPPK
jgi:hypothetical protein